MILNEPEETTSFASILMSVTTRFAPSPTGELHIGSVRTALFSWLFAKRHDGRFLLRIEDTDQARSKQEYTDRILEALEWLGLDFDGKLIFQSQRLDCYLQVAHTLVESGYAYYCVCDKARLEALRSEQIARKIKPRYDNKCRDLGLKPPPDTESVIRFRNPADGVVQVDDLIQGKVEYTNSELDDLVIVRADGAPTYNFAVVVDEIDMDITHVVRGDDHLNNTPRQINLYHAFNKPLPYFGHVPMILSPEGRKLSKRDNVMSVLGYREAGFLPEALLNYLVRLGWSNGNQELFSVNEMVELFDIKDIHKSPAALDPKKLEWINHQHLMQLNPADAIKRATPFFGAIGVENQIVSERGELVFEAQKTRSATLREFVEKSACFFTDFENYDAKAASRFLTVAAKDLLLELRSKLAELNTADWNKEVIHQLITAIVEEKSLKFGALAQPLRVALTGNTISPGIDVTVELIGQDQVLLRLNRAVDWINLHVESKN